MPALHEPDVRFRGSFLRAVADFVAEGRGGPEDHSMIGRDLREWGSRWHDETVFAAYAQAVRAQSLEDSPRPAHFVPTTTLWWAEGAQYLGRIQLRHRLTQSLLELGGHIGYDVAPDHRRQGHATGMLSAFLPRVWQNHGIEEVLITCDIDNIASRKVIETCGGRFEDERQGKLRYWVPTT